MAEYKVLDQKFEGVVITAWNEYLNGVMPVEDIAEFEARLLAGQFKNILGF
jgi:hypothetical protein